MKQLFGLTLWLAGMAVVASAGFAVAPEIDANTAVSAVALLSGGLLVLRSRRRK